MPRSSGRAVASCSSPSPTSPRCPRSRSPLGFADHELGELFAHLKKIGEYDRSLIVVAADHGVAFDLGKRDRRTLTRQNADQVAPIPLFMKASGQKKGKINDSYVELVDILPTIFDILNLRLPVHVDGHSAYSPVVRNRRTLRILQRNTSKPIRIPVAKFEADKKRVLAKKLRLFGTGADGPERIFRIGPHQVASPRRAPDAHRSRWTREGAGRTCRRGDRRKWQDTRRVAHLQAHDGRGYLVAAMVPESSFHDGANKVEVLEVTG